MKKFALSTRRRPEHRTEIVPQGLTEKFELLDQIC